MKYVLTQFFLSTICLILGPHHLYTFAVEMNSYGRDKGDVNCILKYSDLILDHKYN